MGLVRWESAPGRMALHLNLMCPTSQSRAERVQRGLLLLQKKAPRQRVSQKKKAKGKAAPKAKAKAGDDTDDSSDEPDESSEEEPEEKKVAAGGVAEAPAAAAKPKQAWLCIPFYRSLHAQVAWQLEIANLNCMHMGACVWYP